MLRKELCSIALSILWPSDEELAHTMIPATSNCTGNKYLSQIDLDTGGEPSTRFPPERLVELIYMFS